MPDRDLRSGAEPPDARLLLRHLLRLLEGGEPTGAPQTWRRRLTALLTTSRTADIPDDAWPLLDRIWRVESQSRPVQAATELPRLTNAGRWTDAVSLWRGDITRLKARAIVNAANSGLTGCYIPFHACVDNAIHTAAGPWLRAACERIMNERGRPEPLATATATEAFYLPCRYVLHTVGPSIRDGAPTERDRTALAGCYRACLETAVKLAVESIAFCAISTGVFGYPKRDAARIALLAIREFLADRGGALHVVLVAFNEGDHRVYQEGIEEMIA